MDSGNFFERMAKKFLLSIFAHVLCAKIYTFERWKSPVDYGSRTPWHTGVAPKTCVLLHDLEKRAYHAKANKKIRVNELNRTFLQMIREQLNISKRIWDFRTLKLVLKC